VKTNQIIREARGSLDSRLTASEEAEVLRRMEQDFASHFGRVVVMPPMAPIFEEAYMAAYKPRVEWMVRGWVPPSTVFAVDSKGDVKGVIVNCTCCTPDPANEERNERMRGPA